MAANVSLQFQRTALGVGRPQSWRVQLIEADELERARIRRLLADEGFDVREGSLDAGGVDLVLSDRPPERLPAGRDPAGLVWLVRADGVPSQPGVQALERACDDATLLLAVYRGVARRARPAEPSFESVFGAATDAMLTCDDDGRVIDANPAACAMFGWDESSVRGHLLDALTHAESLPSQAGVGESSWRDAAGKMVPVAWSVARIPVAGPGLRLCVLRDMTGQRRMAEALLESENQFRAIFHHAGIGMIVLDLEGFLLRCNKAFCDMLDYAPERLRGHHLLSLTHPDDAAVAVHHWPPEDVSDGVSQQFENRFLRRDGGVVWARITSTVGRGASGAPGFVIATVEDITQRRATGEALRRSEQHLRLVMDNSPAGIFLKDRDGRYQLVNPMTARWLGTTPEAMLGRHAEEFFPPSLLERIRQHDRRVVEMRSNVMEGYHWPQPDGSLRVRETVKFPILDESGNVVGVGGIDSDITERHRTEERLRDSEQRFRHLVENLDDAIFIWDILGDRSLYLNPACARLWDMDDEGGVWGKSRTARGRVHPDDVAMVAEAVAREARGEKSDTEYRLVRRDGSVRWVWDRGVPLHDSDGVARRSICIVKDVTSRRRAEEQRLQRAREQRDALVREVHHRIKNTLQGVCGLLREHARREPALVVPLSAALRQLDAVSVVHGLQGRVPGDRVPLRAMIDALLRDPPRDFRWQLEVMAPADGRTDFHELAGEEAVPVALVIGELITNAVKHAERPAGGVATGTVRMRLEDERVGLEISNPACGLPSGFDFPCSVGIGTGLELAAALLPPAGARLSYRAAHGQVTALLEMEAPVVTCATDLAG